MKCQSCTKHGVVQNLTNYTKLLAEKLVFQNKKSASNIIHGYGKEKGRNRRIYIMNIDHCNSHSSFKDKITMSNLCQEITLPTDPIQHIDGEGEIALCILSALNVGKINHLEELEPLCELAVRSLDEIIDHQLYAVKGRNFYKGKKKFRHWLHWLAHYIAKNKLKYSDKQTKLVDELTEAFQFYLLKHSNELAKEKGKNEFFDRTKYSDGISRLMPISLKLTKSLNENSHLIGNG